jgi:hypothetical protein
MVFDRNMKCLLQLDLRPADQKQANEVITSMEAAVPEWEANGSASVCAVYRETIDTGFPEA